MMLEPAHRAGDAPRTTPEQPHLTVRMSPPAAEIARRTEHDEWLRRRGLERQLHDGAALRISALTLQIGLVRHRAEADLDDAVDALQNELHAVLQELREVADQIYPPLLDQAGLGPALREAADRAGVAVRISAPDLRFGPAAEGVAYFAVAGCLSAVGAAATATAGTAATALPPDELRLQLRREQVGEPPVLVVEIDGVDVRHAGPMLERVWRLGGTIDRTCGAGVGTITARIPCE